MIEATYDIHQATDAYHDLLENKSSPLFVLLKFSSELNFPKINHVVEHDFTPLKPNKDAINIAIIGAGNYARSMHLPNLQSLPKAIT